MTEAQAAPAASRRALRQRYPWLVPGALLLLLALLTANVLTNGPLLHVDRKIRRFVRGTGNSPGWRWLRDGPLTPARLLVDLGNPWLVIPLLMIIAGLVAAQRRTPRPLLTAAAGTALLLAIVIPAKFAIERLNPGYTPFSRHSLLDGFPSGHAAAACVCYTLAVLIIAPYPGGRARRIALTAVTVLGFAVGIALVWLGIHRFTDVVAGWALAALVVPFVVRLTGLRTGHGHERQEQPAGPSAVPASADQRSG
jgi:undecaprenyl-diphosphatase